MHPCLQVFHLQSAALLIGINCAVANRSLHSVGRIMVQYHAQARARVEAWNHRKLRLHFKQFLSIFIFPRFCKFVSSLTEKFQLMLSWTVVRLLYTLFLSLFP